MTMSMSFVHGNWPRRNYVLDYVARPRLMIWNGTKERDIQSGTPSASSAAWQLDIIRSSLAENSERGAESAVGAAESRSQCFRRKRTNQLRFSLVTGGPPLVSFWNEANSLSICSAVIGRRRTARANCPRRTKLLQDFLAGASRNDAAMHDRFWADD